LSRSPNRAKRHPRRRTAVAAIRAAQPVEPTPAAPLDVPLPRRAHPVEPPEPTSAAPNVYPRRVSPEELGATGDDTTLTVELAAKLRQIPVCAHCRGRHTRACPRVKAMKWHPNGTLAAVDFWRDGQWSDEHVIWEEQLAEADDT
jgi:hypothetical protein